MDERELLDRLAQRITQIRQKKGLTKEKMAFGGGAAKSNVTKIESGTRDMRVSTLFKVAEGLSVKLKDLVDFY